MSVINQGDAWIRKTYPGIRPETLEFETWRKLYAESLYLSKIDHENNYDLYHAALIDVANQIAKAFNGNVNTNDQMDS